MNVLESCELVGLDFFVGYNFEVIKFILEECEGWYVYMYDLLIEFIVDIIKNC